MRGARGTMSSNPNPTIYYLSCQRKIRKTCSKFIPTLVFSSLFFYILILHDDLKLILDSQTLNLVHSTHIIYQKKSKQKQHFSYHVLRFFYNFSLFLA